MDRHMPCGSINLNNLEPLKQHLYINPNDARYYEKKVQYLGQHFPSLMELAERREKEGRLLAALNLYQRAEEAAGSPLQQGRAALHRRQLERRLSGQVPGEAEQSAGWWVKQQEAGRSTRRKPTRQNGVLARLWFAVICLLLGVMLGLLGSFLLLQPTAGEAVASEGTAEVADRTRETQEYQLGTREIPQRGNGFRVNELIQMDRGYQPAEQLQTDWISHSGSLFQADGVPLLDEMNSESIEKGLTYLRSGVLGYYLLEGQFPPSLSSLLGAYPRNYLSKIPADPWFGSAKEVTVWDGTGGWVYRKPQTGSVGSPAHDSHENIVPDVLQQSGLLAQVEAFVQPNLPEALLSSASTGKFSPLILQVFPDDQEVVLAAGKEVWLTADAAVGKPESPTPTGDFFVRQRVWLPQAPSDRASSSFSLSPGSFSHSSGRFSSGSDASSLLPGMPSSIFLDSHAYADSAVSPVYGVAGLEFREGYAIHGTEQTERLGEAVTLGCVRLGNLEMARLFTWTPLGTPVQVATAAVRKDGETRKVPEERFFPNESKFSEGHPLSESLHSSQSYFLKRVSREQERKPTYEIEEEQVIKQEKVNELNWYQEIKNAKETPAVPKEMVFSPREEERDWVNTYIWRH